MKTLPHDTMVKHFNGLDRFEPKIMDSSTHYQEHIHTSFQVLYRLPVSAL